MGPSTVNRIFNNHGFIVANDIDQVALEVSGLADRVVQAALADRNKNWSLSLTKTRMVGSTKKSEPKLALRPKLGAAADQAEAADQVAAAQVAQVEGVDRVDRVDQVDRDRLQNLGFKLPLKT